MIKTIEGFGNKFEVSDDGRVFSVARDVSNHTGIIHKPRRELQQRKDQKGYMRVYLDENGKTRFVPVHRLVALAFIPNPKNKPQVNHIDGDKTNNHVYNLEWATNSENQRHAYAIGLNRSVPRTSTRALIKPGFNDGKERRPSGKPAKAVLQIDKITGDVIKRFESIAEASEAMGTRNAGNIGLCCRGLRNQVAGYKWQYAEGGE